MLPWSTTRSTVLDSNGIGSLQLQVPTPEWRAWVAEDIQITGVTSMGMRMAVTVDGGVPRGGPYFGAENAILSGVSCQFSITLSFTDGAAGDTVTAWVRGNGYETEGEAPRPRLNFHSYATTPADVAPGDSLYHATQLGPATVFPVALWTPATDKRFVALTYYMHGSKSLSSGAGDQLAAVVLNDGNPAAAEIDRVIFSNPNAAPAAPQGMAFIIPQVSLGAGYQSSKINQALFVDLVGNIATGQIRVQVTGIEQ